jgi:hypothetical protein
VLCYLGGCISSVVGHLSLLPLKLASVINLLIIHVHNAHESIFVMCVCVYIYIMFMYIQFY